MAECGPCQDTNPCAACGCTEECNCILPEYTNNVCPDGNTTSDCIVVNTPTETCIGIIKNVTTLTGFISSIITYIKNVRNRFINTDGSLLIAPITDTCNDKANIKVKLDPAVNNSLLLRINGLYVAPTAGGAGLTNITLIQANAYIVNNTLTPGAFYLIQNVDVTLYGGTDIILQAITSNSFSLEGTGIFYNPKYNQLVQGYGIYNNSNTYIGGEKVIWGGYLWTNVNGNTGTAINALTLDAAWIKNPYNTTNYNKVTDIIHYDFANNKIVYRADKAGNIVNTSKPSDGFWVSYIGTPISVFQWGNSFNIPGAGLSDNIVIGSYCENINFTGNYFIQNIFTNSSVMRNNTFKLSYFYSNTLNAGIIAGNTLEQSNFSGNTLNTSNFNNNTLTESSSFLHNNLNASSFTSNTLNFASRFIDNILNGGSSFVNNTLNTSSTFVSNLLNASSFNIPNTLVSKSISFVTAEKALFNVNISTATIIYDDYPKTLYTRPDTVIRLRYYNSSDALIITTVTT